jgi:GT2 family glycosyltransferase
MNLTNKKIAIIIPTHNRYVQLQSLVEELLEQRQTNNLQTSVSIVVVSDGSTDGTVEFLQRQTNVLVVNGNGNWWFTKSVNEGAAYAMRNLAPDFLHILNDDCTLPKDYLQILYQLIASENSNIPKLFGPITVDSANPLRVLFAGTTLKYFGLKRVQLAATENPKISSVLPGRGMTIECKLFQELGGFDSRFLQYHSDEDFCLSAKKIGVDSLVYPSLRLGNTYLMTAVGSSIKKTDLITLLQTFRKPQSRNYIKDRILIFWKHQPKLALPVLLAIQYLLILRANYKKTK